MKMTVRFECPHCRLCQTHWKDVHSEVPFVLCCDTEQGGCGRYLAISVRLEPAVTVYTMEQVLEVIDMEPPG